MTIRELIAQLEKVSNLPGIEPDQQVYVGSYYHDILVDSVVLEDGYALILIDGYADGELVQF